MGRAGHGESIRAAIRQFIEVIASGYRRLKKCGHLYSYAGSCRRALGIPATALWNDDLERPHAIYHGEPIAGLPA